MKVAQINVVSTGSTGNIMLNISKLLDEKGEKVRTFSTYTFGTRSKKLPPPPKNHSYFGSYFENFIHTVLGQLTGINGGFSYFGTLGLIKELKKFKPDVIHLHNLHTFFINLPMLMRYIKKNNVPVVWSLHDCWTFTGHCPHFVIAGCDKWKTECHHCPQLSIYPKSRIDNTRMAHRLKKKWFTGVENMTFVAASNWIFELIGQSFLGGYPAKVIHNGIDLSVFKPTPSNFREKYGLENKKILLGVIMGWDERKGIDVFAELAARLDDEYKIVIVGSDDNVRQRMPKNVLCINRTSNQKELAEIYTAADLFVNPTREDTYPTVNLESIACGTPVLTFRTGGSPETIGECGSVVEVNDIDAMEKEIIRICRDMPYSEAACLDRAKAFNMYDRFEEYIELYKEVIKP
ncbi:MAG: glycosyltransferase [Clostridia bacterium]|nr:glycosyltransferase [Clostridia bacterium]